MKFIIVLLAVVAVAVAQYEPVPVLRDNRFQEFDGNYQFDYKTGNGIEHQEEGYPGAPVTNPEEGPAVVVKGSYSYTDVDGKPVYVSYTADENGFHPQGDHFTVPDVPGSSGSGQVVVPVKRPQVVQN